MKICEDFGKTENEDSRGLKRLYSGRNSIPKFRDKLFEDENLKRRKIEETGPRKQHHACRAHAMRLEHGFCYTPMRLEHGACAPSIQNTWGASVFSCFLWVKPAFLAQTQLETLNINTSLPHSEFLIQN